VPIVSYNALDIASLIAAGANRRNTPVDGRANTSVSGAQLRRDDKVDYSPTKESPAMAKDKGARKGNDKTPASKTLKEKRAAKKQKGKTTTN
jgi:hypothetical protein